MTEKKITHFFGGGKNRTTVTGESKGMRGSEKTSSGFPDSAPTGVTVEKVSKEKTKKKTRKQRKPLASVTATAARLARWRREQ